MDQFTLGIRHMINNRVLMATLLVIPFFGSKADADILVFEDSFDKYMEQQSVSGGLPPVGECWTMLFGKPEDMQAQSAISRGGLAMKLVKRPDQQFTGIRAVLKGEVVVEKGRRFIVSADLHVPSSNDSAVLVFDNNHGSMSPRLWIKPQGNYCVWASRNGGHGGRWLDTGVAPTRGGWDRIEMQIKHGNKANTGDLGIKGSPVQITTIEDVLYDVDIVKGAAKDGRRTRIAHDVRSVRVRVGSPAAVAIFITGKDKDPVKTCWDNVTVRMSKE